MNAAVSGLIKIMSSSLKQWVWVAAACLLSSTAPVTAQLFSAGSPVPRRAKPPVVFVNGYQSDCGNASFSGTFGVADQVLQNNGQVSLFFNNCTVAGHPPIETLGAALGDFLNGLRYEDGQPVDAVDVVAHSMGGLIVRSYLSGKQAGSNVFQPPATVPVLKAVFLATPHFGTGIATLFLLNDAQTQELASGSRFLYDLATWNQRTDDLRGVDAVALAGNGGTGRQTQAGFDDGVVTLTSASIQWAEVGRTRVVPYCHIDGSGLLQLAGLCNAGVPGIAHIQSADDAAAKVMVSLFNGTTDWESVGTAALDNQLLSTNGGLDVAARTSDDAAISPELVVAEENGQTKTLNLLSHDVAYTELFPAGTVKLTASGPSATPQRTVVLPPGGFFPFVVKTGPVIARGGVLPAAARVFPLAVAPGELVSIYGEALASQTASVTSAPYPNQLADAQVSFGGNPIGLLAVSTGQINAMIPETASGLMKLAVQNTAGSDSVNVLVEAAVPAVFTQDTSGTGPAAALRAPDNTLVTAANPLHAGDYVQIFLTGLGATTNHDGLDYANQQPTVSIGGADCHVTYAGRAPLYPGLDQINCIVPSGVSNNAAPLVVVSGKRASSFGDNRSAIGADAAVNSKHEMQHILELRGVSKQYPTHRAVDDVGFGIERGSFFSLLGPSGCGKTTTLRMIAGFEAPTSGDIALNGKTINHLRPYQRNVSTVFQNYALFPHLTVRGNVEFGLRQKGLRDNAAR